MAELDSSIYNNVGKFPSFQDVQGQVLANSQNKLQQLLLANQVQQLPIANQLQQLQLSTGTLTNAQLQQKMGILQQFMGRLQGNQPQQPPADPNAAPPVAAPSQPSVMAGSGSQPSFMSSNPTMGGSAPVATSYPVGNVPATPHAGGALGNMDPDTLALGELAGVVPEGFTKLWMENQFGRPMPPGYRQNLNGTTSFFGDPSKGITIDGQGNVVPMPGAASALGAIASATKAGETAGANSQTLAPIDRLGPDGRPINKTVGQLVAEAGGGAPGAAPTPAPGAAPTVATATPLDGLPLAAQMAVIKDMQSRGQDLSTLQINGQPAMAPMQTLLDNARQAGGEGIAALQAKVLPQILAIQDPTQRQQALAQFTADIAAPHGTPIHTAALPGAPSAPAGGSPFMGPADLAAQKLAAEQAVHLQTDPQIKLSTNLVTQSHDANQKFVTDLGDIVNNEGELVARNNRLQPLLDQLPNIGGFGQAQRADFANKLKNSGMLPQAALDTLSTKIAGGDPDAAKVVQNQLSAAAIQTMLDTLNKEGKPNRIMYQALHEQQEGLDAGKPVLQNIMALQNQLYQQHLGQYNQATDLMASPTYNPIRFGSQFATMKSQGIQPGSGSPGAPAAATAKTVNFADLK